MYARPFSHNMTCAVLLQLQAPVELSREVSKLQRLFLLSNPVEIDLLVPKVNRKYAK